MSEGKLFTQTPWWLLAASDTANALDGDDGVAGGPSPRGSHRFGSARECERYWWYRFYKRVRLIPEREPEFRIAGTLIHRVLAEYWAGRMDESIRPRWWAQQSLHDVIFELGVGTPKLCRSALAIGEVYEKHRIEDQLTGLSTGPWRPIAVERLYTAAIGEIDPGGVDSTLDDLTITCRPDLIIESQPHLGDKSPVFIVDHKSQSLAWGRKTLGKWDHEEGEYALSWQAMWNLHCVRARMPNRDVAGFIISRVSRGEPYQSDFNVLQIPAPAYEDMRRSIRAVVAMERDLGLRVAQGHQPIPNFSACYSRWGACDMRRLCKAQSEEKRAVIMDEEYYVLPESAA